VVTGRMLHGRLLTHIVWQCGACPDGVGIVVAVSVNLRCGIVPAATTTSVEDGILDVPCLVCRRHLRQTTATVRRECVGYIRLSPRFARRDTRVWGCRNPAERTLALRQYIVETTAERGGQSAHLAATGYAPTCCTTQRRRGAGVLRQVRLAPDGSSRQVIALPESPTPRQASPLCAAVRWRSPLPPQYVAGIGTLCIALPQFPYKKVFASLQRSRPFLVTFPAKRKK
jgi:hypothetical protein